MDLISAPAETTLVEDALPEGDPNVLGFVESVSAEQVSGWAFNRSGDAVQLTLAIGDDIVESERLIWTRRPDVAAANGHVFERCGFVIPFAPDEAERARLVLDQGGEIYVLANGYPLPTASTTATATGAVAPAMPAASVAPVRGGRANLEKAARFVISGWAVNAAGLPSTITLQVNQQPIDCLVLSRERRDVAEALRLDTADVGFDIELPAAIWSRRVDDEPIRIDVLADGFPIGAEPLRLTPTLAATWLFQLGDVPSGPERDALSLLAIEHVRAARLLDLLDERATLQVRWLAARSKLEGYLYGDQAMPLDAVDVPRETGADVLMRSALRELNRLIGADPGRVMPHLKQVLATPELTGEVRGWLLNLGAQLTCGTGEFLQMRELMDLADLQRFERSGEPHQMTLALPALVADGYVKRATDLMFRLSKRLSAGWVHTECIRFSVEHVGHLELAGEIEPEAADEFRRALVAVLGGFKADWFSRLHDHGLIDAFIAALSGLDGYADDHRELLTTAAIWHYGLSPTFWTKWNAREGRPRNADLDHAEQAWNRILAVFQQPHEAMLAGLSSLVEPLGFFHRRGNPEALQHAREFVLTSLLGGNRAPEGAERRMIEILFDADRREAVRVAAFPTEGPNRVQDSFPETSDREKLSETIATGTTHTRGRFRALHRAASGALRRAADAVRAGDASALQAALADLDVRAQLLLRPECQYVGADLMANACLLALRGGESASSLAARIDRLGRAVRRAGSERRREALPVAFQTAVQGLGSLARDPATAAPVRAMRDAVRESFGERYDDLFQEARETPGLDVRDGWPHDTVVAIASCRRYLDSRVQAIRDTWLPRLVAAGIPYVIVVGDGSDRLDGDVLALDVPDGYEHRTRKTLRMFEWLLRNTPARYVVRIEDDCQLDVAAYFDALTYRKFAYYGRVVHRRPGDLDRVGFGWHAPAAPGEASVFDRSPETSTSCDGRVGYSLSRGAMACLVAATHTTAGKRLVAVSTREDKLVGDLLATAAILPDDEDYEAFLQTRLLPDAVPVCAGGDNAFDIGPLSPTLVSHRGRLIADDQAVAELFPKTIWPTCAPPSIGAQGNALQLLTPVGRAHAVLRAPHAVVAVMRNEREIAPHFLAHYRQLGITSFLVADNGSTDGTRELLLEQPDVVLYSAGTDYRHSHFGVSWQQAMLANHCLGKWVIVADADEFLVYEDSETRPFADLVAQAEYEDASAVVTYMVDLYPQGPLDQASFASRPPFEVADHFDARPLVELHIGGGLYSNTTNHVNGLRHRVAPTRIDAYTSQKCAVLKYFPWVRLSEGAHYAANVRPASSPAFFAHFKYHAAFTRKVAEEVRRKQHFNDAEEYRHFAAILGPGKSLYAEGVSTRYRGSDDFMALFDPDRVSHHDLDEEGREFGTPGDSAGPDAA